MSSSVLAGASSLCPYALSALVCELGSEGSRPDAPSPVWMPGAERRRQQEASDAAPAKLRESQHAPASPSLILVWHESKHDPLRKDDNHQGTIQRRLHGPAAAVAQATAKGFLCFVFGG